MNDSVMDFIEAWVREHIYLVPYRPPQDSGFAQEVCSRDSARAEELAKWLRKDAAESGISDAEIDQAIAGLIGAGHGLVNCVSDAMAKVTDLTVSSPGASRLADEAFEAGPL